MSLLPKEIYPVAAVREIDRTAIEDEGISGYQLMTRAASAAVAAARLRCPDASVWQVVCGAGNNAGDGYVVARLAAEEGIAVSVIALVDPEKLGGDAATAYADFAAGGGIVLPWSGELHGEIIFDGILGSGLERPVEGAFAEAVSAINSSRAFVVALDIPTGLHGDSGAVLGTTIRADLTVTFVGLKAGLFVGEGPRLTGDLEFAGLEIPDHCRDPSAAVMYRIDDSLIGDRLPPRSRTAHKGDFGHVLIVGGGPGMPGAALLAGEAALRSGAGRVSLATHPDHAAIVVARRPELMAHAIQDGAELGPLLDSADVIAFGPGLGTSDWARGLFDVQNESKLPAVWDADALNLLADAPGKSPQRVITPHPGEAGRLLGRPASEVQQERLSSVAELQATYGGVAVLKGAGSLVSTGDGVPWISTAGNPGMAAPGMGDALTGAIAALLGQGLDPGTAARTGVLAHARAGDLAAADGGERGLIASDLIAQLRRVLNP